MADTSNIDQWLDNPAVKALIEKLQGLESKMAELAAAVEPAEAQVATLKQEKQDWMASLQQEMDRRDAAIRAADAVAREIRMGLNEARQMSAMVNKELTTSLASLEAEAKRKKMEEDFITLMDQMDFAWRKSIREFQWLASSLATQAYEDGVGGFAFFDQMGLGKTLEAWATIEMIRTRIIQKEWYNNHGDEPMPKDVDIEELGLTRADLSVLWVCPNTIKTSTMKELQKWGCDLVVKVEGNPQVRMFQAQLGHENGAVVIANYETLHRTEGLLDLEFPIVVMDEAHRFKNDGTITFKSVETLAENADFVIPMTGTPILNRPEELWAILHMLTLHGKYQGRFDNKYRFINEYCWTGSGSPQFVGNAGDRLVKSMGDMVIRRRKDEVALELPDKERIVHFVTLGEEQRGLYDQLRDKLYMWLDEEEGEALTITNFLQQLTRFRQMALYPAGIKIERADGTELVVDCQESAKIDAAMDIIEELMDNGEKCLIFANFNDALFEIQRRLEGRTWTKITDDGVEERPLQTGAIVGGVNEIKRSDLVDRFNDPDSDLRVMVGNISAMGVGLNLQGACSNAIFLDLFWNPGINEQAEDRLHRGGQKNNVQIHILHAEDTVDNFVAMIIERKQGMIEGTIERKELRRMIDEGMI